MGALEGYANNPRTGSYVARQGYYEEPLSNKGLNSLETVANHGVVLEGKKADLIESRWKSHSEIVGDTVSAKERAGTYHYGVAEENRMLNNALARESNRVKDDEPRNLSNAIINYTDTSTYRPVRYVTN
jgi:hypothetical protein